MKKETAWWKRTFIYQIYPKSFLDTTGSGTGDLEGIIRRLDYLKKLGAGALWLTPVYPSPGVDNGYDISDYTAIDPAYGTMADFERLAAEAGKRGIRILMDLVYNHSSDRHPWFLTSKRDRTNEKADWYIWRDPKEGTVIPADGSAPEGGEPTNWRGIFGGSVWTWCPERRQYYYHTFAKEQPDLNWELPEVRRALFDAARFWLDHGAGGFRIDAITYIKKPAVLRDGVPDSPDGTVSVHTMTANTPGILDLLREFRKEVFDGRDIVTVGEANGVPAEELKDWVGQDGVFSMLFEFSHVLLPFEGPEIWCRPKPWRLTELKRAFRKSQDAVKDQGWLPVYFENHDRARSVNYFFEQPFTGDAGSPDAAGSDEGRNADSAAAGSSPAGPGAAEDRQEVITRRAKALAAVLFTLRGTPFVYQGEELGMPDADWKDPAEFNDLSTRWQYENALREGFSPEEALKFAAFFSRDNARTPMQWSAEENAGFSPAGAGAAAPWLPVHEDHIFRNAAAEEQDPDSVLHCFRRLAALRAGTEELVSGGFEDLLPESEDIYCFARVLGDRAVITAVNFGSRETEVPWDTLLKRLPAGVSGGSREVLFSSVPEHSARRDAEAAGETLRLRPLEARILRI